MTLLVSHFLSARPLLQRYSIIAHHQAQSIFILQVSHGIALSPCIAAKWGEMKGVSLLKLPFGGCRAKGRYGRHSIANRGLMGHKLTFRMTMYLRMRPGTSTCTKGLECAKEELQATKA